MNNETRDFAIRDIGCIYCLMFGIEGYTPCRKHHLNEGDKAGGKRVGEKATVGACDWHHVGVCFHTQTKRPCDTCARLYGPSMYHDKRAFMERFGSGEAQLAYQDNLISNWCNPRATFPGLVL